MICLEAGYKRSSQGSVLGFFLFNDFINKMEKGDRTPARQLWRQHQTICSRTGPSFRERSRQAGGMYQQKHHVSQQAQMQSCNTLVQAGDWPTWEQFCQESLWVLADSPLHMKQQCSLAGRKTVSILGYIKRSVASVLIHSYLALFTWQSRMLHSALGPPIQEAGVTPVV